MKWCLALLFLFMLMILFNSSSAQNTCEVLPVPENGIIEYDQDFNISERIVPILTIATYNCDRSGSFALVGDVSRTCDFVGGNPPVFAWTGSAPICTVVTCPELNPELENGVVTYSDPPHITTGGYTEGVTATYDCNEGFGLNGFSTRVCSGNLTQDVLIEVVWRPIAPTCDPQCPLIPSPNFVQGIRTVTYTPDRFVNAIAIHTCLAGYTPVTMSLQRVCENNNGIFSWSLPEVICEPFCQDLSRIDNGFITYSPNELLRRLGTTANYSCDFGFMLRVVGSQQRTCERQRPSGFPFDIGGWSGEEPQCLAECPLLTPDIANGVAEIVYEPDRLIDGTARHTCLPGYTNTTFLERICVNNTDRAPNMHPVEWSSEEVLCEPFCGDLSAITNGFITYSPSELLRRLGTTATYSCAFGFMLVSGSQQRTCERQSGSSFDIGGWSGEEPQCVPGVCPVIERGVGIASVVYSDPNREVGSVATHTCLPNFVPNDDLIRTCLRNSDNVTASWDLPEETCRPICLDLPPLDDGTISYNPDEELREVDTTANYTCNEGFRYSGGDVERVCEEVVIGGVLTVANWTGTAGRCIPQCPVLDPLMNGVITYNNIANPEYDEGTLATHECNPGFVLNGTNPRVCLSSGEWSGAPPVCLPIQCPMLPPFENGNITYSPDDMADYDLGTNAAHACNFGYILRGVEIRVCEEGAPGSTVGEWSEEAPSCQPIICPPLPLILNGNIRYSRSPFIVGTVANYSCNSGYCLDPSSVRVCQINGTWSGVEGRCNLIICPVLTAPENGAITYSVEDTSMIPVGATATYSCIPSHSLVGGPEVRTCVRPDFAFTCPTGTWTPSPPPTCSPSNIVNDTATGDPLMTVPLYIQDKSAIMSQSALDPNDIINLCYELHGNSDAFFNLVSDVCVSVNAHYEMVLPSDPREDVNIIDNIYVRATDNAGICRNIEVALNAGVCTASVDGVNIDSMYRSEGVYVRRYSNRVRIGVPNCNELDLVMWVFCLENRFWSSYRVDSFGREVVFDAPMIKFVIARGFNLQETSHGIIGQFWNIPIQVEAFTGSARPNVSTERYFEVTVNHPNEVRRFTGWLYPLTWEYRSEYCLYAGNQQAGPVYEVVSPNDAVIEGEYADYRVNSSYSTDFMYNEFDETRCT